MNWRIRGCDSFQYLNDIVDSSDTFLISRKMVDRFIPYRSEVVDKLNDLMNAFTKNDGNTKNYFSHKLIKSW
jgi:hypothetical protein